MFERKNMQIAIQILTALTIIGGITIGILLYYNKQTPAVWVTFFTVMFIVLSFCLYWQNSINDKNVSKKNKELEQGRKEVLTLKDLFNKDFNNLLRVEGEKVITNDKGNKINIKTTLYLDFETQTEFIGFFIPNTLETYNICILLLKDYKTVFQIKDKVKVESSAPGLQPVNIDDLKFSGRIFIYHEYPLFEKQKRKLSEIFEKQNLSVQFRGTEYVLKKMK